MKLIPMLIHLPLIFWLLYRLQKYWQAPSLLFWSSFLLKLIAGVSVGLLYRFYYSENDTWVLFEEATKLSAVAGDNVGRYLYLLWSDDNQSMREAGMAVFQDRSLLFIRIISVINLLALQNYWVVSFYFSVIAFASSWWLYQRVADFSNDPWAAAIAFLLCPSIVFWSSGIIKETLALSGIFVLTAVILKFVQAKKLSWVEWLLILPALYVSWGLKYYWTAVFLVSAISVILYYIIERKFSGVARYRLPAWLLLFLFLLLAASMVHPNFYLERFLEVVVTNHDLFIQVSGDDDVIHFSDVQQTWWSVVKNAPLALLSALFRPFVWEASGATAWMAAIENMILLVLWMTALPKCTRLFQNPHRNVLYGMIAYIVLLAIFLALSTPNFGTLSRYRVGFLPFFVFLIAYKNPLLVWLKGKRDLSTH